VLSRSAQPTIIPSALVTDPASLAPAASSPVSEHAVTFVRRSKATGEEQTFHVIGTAHVSQKSIDEVRDVIARVRPDTVCVELCATRFAALTDPTRFRSLDVPLLVRDGRAGFTLATFALQAFQKRMGDKLGVRPGAELLAATEAAKAIGAELVLADRDVQITLKRTWSNLGAVKRATLLVGLFASAFGEDAMDELDVESLKKREHISDMMGELGKKLPEVKVPLIDERDLYLLSHLEAAPGKTVVAVVGAGHLEGMLKNLGQTIDRAALEQLPRPGFAERLRAWAPVVLWLLALCAGVARGVPSQKLLVACAAPIVLATLGLLLAARARVESLLVGALTAPLLALVPAAPGRVLGGLEAALREPKPEDGARIGQDVTSLRTALANPVTRTLLVGVAADYGVGFGRLISIAWLLLRAIFA
jgi:pheromone shutdown-related protein TraB